MEITLVSLVNTEEKLIASFAKICRSKDNLEKIYNEMTDKDCERLIKNIIDDNHLSLFEHTVFTFFIKDISRVATHQLIRHRIASYTQLSERYTNVNNFCILESMSNNEEVKKQLQIFYNGVVNFAKELEEKGLSKQQIRYIYPQSSASNILVTMNLRSMFNFLSLRLAKDADEEIKSIAKIFYNAIKVVMPITMKYWSEKNNIVVEENTDSEK